MELRINLAFIAVLGIVALFGRAKSPEWVNPGGLNGALVSTEDAFFREMQTNENWAGAEAFRSLLKSYVDAGQPALAVALAGRARAQSRRDPYVTYQLARAYGELGRFRDASDAAKLARARCESEMYGAERLAFDRSPCSARLYVAMDTHARAMDVLVRWNVSGPDDSRYSKAFEVVQRTARLASTDAGP